MSMYELPQGLPNEFKKIPEKLGIDAKPPAGQPKAKFRQKTAKENLLQNILK